VDEGVAERVDRIDQLDTLHFGQLLADRRKKALVVVHDAFD